MPIPACRRRLFLLFVLSVYVQSDGDDEWGRWGDGAKGSRIWEDLSCFIPVHLFRALGRSAGLPGLVWNGWMGYLGETGECADVPILFC